MAEIDINEALALGKALARQFSGVAKLGEVCDRVGALAAQERDMVAHIEALKAEADGLAAKIAEAKEAKVEAEKAAAAANAARDAAKSATKDAKTHQATAEAQHAAVEAKFAEVKKSAQATVDGINKRIVEAQERAVRLEAEHQARLESLKKDQANIIESTAQLSKQWSALKSQIANTVNPLLA